MCGIAGIFDRSNARRGINHDVLKDMSDVIIHRGPDSDGQWISEENECALSFRRLAIIDLSEAGNQPMTTPDGRYTIVFNGEIYNHKELRQDLINKGYQYKSGTDTETILFGFAEYGSEVVEKLIGMWAIAIWDEYEKKLFCSRDRIGIKPLYYYYKDGLLVFASEIKSILCHPSVSKEFNIEQLPIYLNFGMSGNRDSMFKNIHKIPAGHKLIVDKNSEPIVKRYWTPISSDNLYTRMSEKDAITNIMDLLRLAVKDRMMSDVPFGVFLSGGVDSSLNVALMAELMDRPVDTYSVGFKELEKYNELDYARRISTIYNTNHHEILIDSTDAFPILEELTWHEDEPNADPVCMPLWFLSKLTRDSGTIVIQVGEGSDEQFVGYPWMMREYNFERSYFRPYSNLPSFLKESVYSLLKPMFSSMGQYLPLDYIRRATNNEELYWSGNSIFPPVQQEKLFSNNYCKMSSIPGKYGTKINREARAINPNADYLQTIAYAELQQRLSEILLMRVDKIGMAHSIEARVPFLDHRLVEFTFSLPPKMKVPDNKVTKYILKKAVESVLPHDIIYRKKQGFWAPVNEWLRNEWFDYSREAVINSPFVESGIFDRKFLEILFERHKQKKGNLGLSIFTLLTLTLWYKRFFNNEKIEL